MKLKLLALSLLSLSALAETEQEYVNKAAEKARISYRKREKKKLIRERVKNKYKSRIEALRLEQKLEAEEELKKEE